MERAEAFEIERPRLTRIASHLLGDPHEAEDIVQKAWLRLIDSPSEVIDLPAWLTTVTTRLCLDRLKARIPAPAETNESTVAHDDPAAAAERAEAVGHALHIVVETLTPNERVAFVLADTFGFDFATIGEILERNASSARQLASRARKKVASRQQPSAPVSDWQVVDAFMEAARGGDLARLLALLAPDAEVSADSAAILAGTPTSIEGKEAVAAFFNGSARAALPAFIAGRPGAAWFYRGEAKVAFDFALAGSRVQTITFRADPDVLAQVTTRRAAAPNSQI